MKVQIKRFSKNNFTYWVASGPCPLHRRKAIVHTGGRNPRLPQKTGVINEKSLHHNKTGNPYSIALLLVFFVFIISLFTSGCSQNASPKTTPTPSIISTPGTTGVSPPESPVIPKESPDDKMETPGEEETSDDGSGDLDDMYIRIYGQENISIRDETPYFDPGKAYKDIMKIKPGEYDRVYREILDIASRSEKRQDYREAVQKYREAAFMEKAWKLKTATAQKSLKSIRDSMFQKALELYNKERFPEALPSAEIAVLCDPSRGESLKIAGKIFAETGEEGLAIPYLSMALSKNENDYELQHRLKTLYMLEGMPEKAIPLINENSASYGRIKSHNEELAGAYLMMYIKSPDKREEVTPKIKESLEKAIKARKKSVIATAELKMNLALFEKRYGDAISYCNDMMKMNLPFSIKTRLIYNIALLSHLKGDDKQCREYLLKTVERVMKKEGRSQGENYMAQMSCWFLEMMGEKPFTSRRSEEIYSRVINPDHSYRQEYGFIREFLTCREKRDYSGAIKALKKYTGKRHLEPVGYFVEDLLQVPAQKSLIYISMGKMYRESGDEKKARQCFLTAGETPFLKDTLHSLEKNQ